MTETVLPYDHGVTPQEQYWDCGPASTQVVLSGRGIVVSEDQLIADIGTTENGTDSIDWITPVLNQYLDGGYSSVWMPNDPPTDDQRERLWNDIVAAVDGGYGIVANIIAPPGNYPRGVNGSSDLQYSGGTVYHYVALMGYATDVPDAPGGRAVWWADPGFAPHGAWISLDQTATLIPNKGYSARTSGDNGGGGIVDTATQFGIDVSNHQGNFDFAGAASEGYVFATHKISEGTGYADPYWPRARDLMNQYFPNRWGGYVFVKVDTDPGAEADFALGITGPGVPIQIDYEDSARTGSGDDLRRRVQAYVDRGAHLLPIYLPRWYWQKMGSPDLSDLPVNWWNSSYVNGSGYGSTLYENGGGDTQAGWNPFGGRNVDILQFTDRAKVAGQLIDANAIRGGLSAVDALFTQGGVTPTPPPDGGGMTYDEALMSDVKDLRQQDTGSRDLVLNEDGTVNLDASYPGWAQLGGTTRTDALSVIGWVLRIPGFEPVPEVLDRLGLSDANRLDPDMFGGGAHRPR